MKKQALIEIDIDSDDLTLCFYPCRFLSLDGCKLFNYEKLKEKTLSDGTSRLMRVDACINATNDAEFSKFICDECKEDFSFLIDPNHDANVIIDAIQKPILEREEDE